ncbi:hypothetical protein Bbelb_331820 [Branchiostoma belcheri]|nr:hypothetical protein Bbelb_331820 [Branchiostoma belcheri]
MGGGVTALGCRNKLADSQITSLAPRTEVTRGGPDDVRRDIIDHNRPPNPITERSIEPQEQSRDLTVSQGQITLREGFRTEKVVCQREREQSTTPRAARDRCGHRSPPLCTLVY